MHQHKEILKISLHKNTVLISTRLEARELYNLCCLCADVLLCQPMSVSTFPFLLWDPSTFQFIRTACSWLFCLKSMRNNNALELSLIEFKKQQVLQGIFNLVPSTASQFTTFSSQTRKQNWDQEAWAKSKKAIRLRQELL